MYTTKYISSLEQKELWDIYLLLKKDCLLDVFFYDWLEPGAKEFIEWCNSGDMRAVYCDGEFVGFYLLNNHLGKSSMIHFCIMRDFYHQSREIGHYVLNYIFSQKRGEEYAYSSVFGLTPVIYRHALNYIKDLGFQKMGIIPDAVYFRKKGRYYDSVSTLLTREVYMGGGGGGKSPSYDTPAEVAPTPEPPTQADKTVQEAGDAERKRRQAASGQSSTILTGGQGLSSTPSTTTGKTLLGQ